MSEAFVESKEQGVVNGMQEAPKQEEVKQEEVKQEEKEVAPNPVLEKVLKEKRNAMQKIQELEGQLQEKVDAELKAKEDWKSLSERYETEKNDWKAKYETLQNGIVDGYKASALRRELSKLGADEQSMEFLLNAAKPMMSDLKYDDEHKVVMGGEVVAEQIKNAIPKAFGKVSAGANHDAPQAVPSDLTLESYKNMSLEDRKKNMGAIFEKHGVKLKK